eukprot:gnl/Ergobibamus_cyprinoides/3610.p2 GENE.gnl/Ergobibamus_cyprinoides/3610~~gnl/Ergobibamus_cyprinoides/3610.p2  ORF type:complete len:193 (-),score=28.60 gnl/Ergobibamus_cyprinoides/3610:113-691(-)
MCSPACPQRTARPSRRLLPDPMLPNARIRQHTTVDVTIANISALARHVAAVLDAPAAPSTVIRPILYRTDADFLPCLKSRLPRASPPFDVAFFSVLTTQLISPGLCARRHLRPGSIIVLDTAAFLPSLTPDQRTKFAQAAAGKATAAELVPASAPDALQLEGGVEGNTRDEGRIPERLVFVAPVEAFDEVPQ